ncbi:hypothetical protein BS78_01G233700 [Paspalum vaginatum]|nr:hypothetical protein BS78_01G233700 [Paspalum vaginatum]
MPGQGAAAPLRALFLQAGRSLLLPLVGAFLHAGCKRSVLLPATSLPACGLGFALHHRPPLFLLVASDLLSRAWVLMFSPPSIYICPMLFFFRLSLLAIVFPSNVVPESMCLIVMSRHNLILMDDMALFVYLFLGRHCIGFTQDDSCTVFSWTALNYVALISLRI